MTCDGIGPLLSSYLDGELALAQSCEVLRHLDLCAACRRHEQDLRTLRAQLRTLPVPAPPPQLALRLRVSASRYTVRRQRFAYQRMRLEMFFRAIAVPATAGTVVALSLFIFLLGNVSRRSVNVGQGPDVPIVFSTPPRVAVLAGDDIAEPMLVEASVDDQGRVYNYRVLRGHPDQQELSRLNDVLLMSVFRPATTIFGRPTSGNVLVRFSTVRVRG